MRAAFPDLYLSVDDMITEGDRVVLRGVVHGTHQGAFLGIAPTGIQVAVFAIDVYPHRTW
jgi:predicted ester cyclase